VQGIASSTSLKPLPLAPIDIFYSFVRHLMHQTLPLGSNHLSGPGALLRSSRWPGVSVRTADRNFSNICVWAGARLHWLLEAKRRCRLSGHLQPRPPVAAGLPGYCRFDGTL